MVINELIFNHLNFLQAMWSDEVLLVELVKSDRGLGFSILDYQVSKEKFWIV